MCSAVGTVVLADRGFIAAEESAPDGREAPLNRLIRAMLFSLGAGLVVGAVIFLAHDQIVATQLVGAHPAPGAVASTRGSLSVTLWSRPAPSIVVALLYPLFIRRLHSHQRCSYRRVLIVAVLQLVALAWYTAGADDPLWLRILQAAQASAVLVV